MTVSTQTAKRAKNQLPPHMVSDEIPAVSAPADTTVARAKAMRDAQKPSAGKLQTAIGITARLLDRNLGFLSEVLIQEISNGEQCPYSNDVLNVADLCQEKVEEMGSKTYADYDSFAADYVSVVSLIVAMSRMYSATDTVVSNCLARLAGNSSAMFNAVEIEWGEA